MHANVAKKDKYRPLDARKVESWTLSNLLSLPVVNVGPLLKKWEALRMSERTDKGILPFVPTLPVRLRSGLPFPSRKHVVPVSRRGCWKASRLHSATRGHSGHFEVGRYFQCVPQYLGGHCGIVAGVAMGYVPCASAHVEFAF